jgi:hypothetical protein
MEGNQQFTKRNFYTSRKESSPSPTKPNANSDEESKDPLTLKKSQQ